MWNLQSQTLLCQLGVIELKVKNAQTGILLIKKTSKTKLCFINKQTYDPFFNQIKLTTRVKMRSKVVQGSD